jgi:hypothetical protein
VTAAQCCGGRSPPRLWDVTAVNRDALGEFTAPCALVDCATTIFPIPAHFGATCSAGHCIAFDLREKTELVECSERTECVLRRGLSCCEGCAGEVTEFVALRGDADLVPLVCGAGPIGCPTCEPVPDPSLSAECLDGRCEVVAQQIAP